MHCPRKDRAWQPTQNGRHERLHRTLKKDTASPPTESLAEQRERFTAFQHCFNEQCPHQALLMQTPVSLYNPSSGTSHTIVAEIRYDERYIVRPVRKNGTIRWKGREVFITEVLRRERIGLFRHRMEHSRSTSDRCTWASSKAKQQHSTRTDSVCHTRKHMNSPQFPVNPPSQNIKAPRLARIHAASVR